MKTLKMTSKRQVTFPVEVCRELGVETGSEIYLEKRRIENHTEWILRPRRDEENWYGSLRSYAKGKSHDREDIRNSIRKKRYRNKP